jgi:hypothetical protein
MSRYVAKAMYLEKPKRIVVWDGEIVVILRLCLHAGYEVAAVMNVALLELPKPYLESRNFIEKLFNVRWY